MKSLIPLIRKHLIFVASLFAFQACCWFCPPKEVSCEDLPDDEKCNCLKAAYDPHEYIVYFNENIKKDDSPDRLKRIVIDYLETEFDHRRVTTRRCLCNDVVLMRIPPDVDPNEHIAKAKSPLNHDEHGVIGAIGRNYQLAIGPLDLLPPLQTSYDPEPTETTTNPVVVSIVDMGIDFNHPSLRGNIWENPNPNEFCLQEDIDSYNFKANNASDKQDRSGHGTHIAGIISLENPNNTNPTYNDDEKDKLNLMSLKITENDSQDSDLFSAICAIRYAIYKGAGIINLSWGYYSDRPDATLKAVIETAKQKGILVVTSAGNDGLDTDICNHWPSSFSRYEKFKHVISVAALNSDLTDLAEFSNYGENSVQIAAPGTNVRSTFPMTAGEIGCKALSGTSMAAPFVTRYAAILKIQNPDFSFEDLRTEIFSNLTPLPGITKFPKQKVPFENDLICPEIP